MRGTGTLTGGAGDDRLRLFGPGKVFGGPGKDSLELGRQRGRYAPDWPLLPHNGEGPRTFKAGRGSDVVNLYGPHDDTIYLADGERDRIYSCGPGKDTVYFDRGIDKFDADNDCERRIPR